MIDEHNLAKWTQIIRECRESGLSINAFCKKTGISRHTYFYWQKKLRDKACEQFIANQAGTVQSLVVPQGFTEVRVHDAPTPSDENAEKVLPIAVEATISMPQMDTGMQAHCITASPAYVAPKGQIRIDTGGCQITADVNYPTDKLARLLRELMRP